MWQGWMKCSPTPPPALPVYPAGGDPIPQRTRNDCTRQAAGQAVPKPGQTTQGTAHTPGRWTRYTGLHSILDRPRGADQDGGGRWTACATCPIGHAPNGQNYCKQKYSFFMCKPLDKRNKIVYNIDSKQTYLHHHKTGGQKP